MFPSAPLDFPQIAGAAAEIDPVDRRDLVPITLPRPAFSTRTASVCGNVNSSS